MIGTIDPDEIPWEYRRFTTYNYNDDRAYCEWIQIDDEYQNHGYGTKALELLSDEFGGIEVAPNSEASQRLYQRIGTESNWWDGMDYDQGFGLYTI